MKKITKIEKDSFYIWINKIPDESERGFKLNLKEILVGTKIGPLLKAEGAIKLQRFFKKDLKKERSCAYRYEKRFKKTKNSKWLIISKNKVNKIPGCTLFKEINVISHKDIYKTDGRQPIRSKQFIYIVDF